MHGQGISSAGLKIQETEKNPNDNNCHLDFFQFLVSLSPLSLLLHYNQTQPYGHQLNTYTSLLQTVCFVPRERKPLHFL